MMRLIDLTQRMGYITEVNSCKQLSNYLSMQDIILVAHLAL